MSEGLLTFLIENSEKLGVVIILLLVVSGLIYIVRHLDIEKKHCEESRYDSNAAIGELKGDVRVLSAKMETEVKQREVHLEQIKQLHTDVLTTVTNLRNGNDNN